VRGEDSGKLRFLGTTPSLGSCPRGMVLLLLPLSYALLTLVQAMHPQADVLYCANQDSDCIVAFKVKPAPSTASRCLLSRQAACHWSAALITSEPRLQVTSDGNLDALGQPLHVPTPVCIAFQ
jgi:6-phosphogluconolactonase (cycloisomerase 2 family)